MTKIVMENTSGNPVDTRYVPSFILTIKKGASTRASHLVLRNVELFQEILRYLPVHPSRIDYFRVPDRENCSTLARLARVCKAFCDPTLATLWRTLTSLHSLLLMIPENLASDHTTQYSVSRSEDLQHLSLMLCLG